MLPIYVQITIDQKVSYPITSCGVLYMGMKSSSRASVYCGNTTSELACRTGYSYSFVCIGRVYIHPVYWSYLRFFSCASSGNEEQDLLRNTYNFFLVFKVLGLKKSQKKQKKQKIFRNGLTRTLFFVPTTPYVLGFHWRC